ncbi:MAG TPA: GNAT family N-acetyltransferase [Dehalococcoidia bacterium]|nr:GNAT family N-acetyltransferase [Dehalococcoidia bacterium]
MTEELTIRRVTSSPEDIETLVQMRYAMQAELHEWRTGADPKDIVDVTREYFQKQLSGFHFAAFFVQYGSEIVATGGVVVYDNPPSPSNRSGTEGYVMNMYTVPHWRGHGLARRILDRLVEHAHAEGAGRVWLRASKLGRRVYEKAGFRSYPDYMEYRIPEEHAP